MKLHLSLLEKFIEPPSKDIHEIRQLLDDLGLEVKDTSSEEGRVVYTIETLANRGDTLSALGVARELSARLLSALKTPVVAAELPDRRASLNVSVVTPKCLRYALLELTLPSPFPLRSDIAAVLGASAEDRPAIVDILNYVQLELGQPMHAFDRERLEGELIIDTTKQEETVEALDGKRYTVPPESLVIRDRKKIVAVAGVIGCANSMVSTNTTRVALESACFDPISVRKTARKMGLSTDASYVFERGSDPENVKYALRRVLHLASGAGGVVKSADSAHVLGMTYVEQPVTERRKITFSLSQLREEMNLQRLTEVEVTSRLKNLGFQFDPAPAPGDPKKKKDVSFTVTVPSWRHWDLKNPEDMIEEFVRVHGLNKVKYELPPFLYEPVPKHPFERLTEEVETSLLGSGFVEVMSRSFYHAADVALLAQLDPISSARHIAIKNAVESNYSHLRLTPLLHFARIAESNHRKGVQSVKIYEWSRSFSLPASDAKNQQYEYERDILSLAVSGRWNHNEWKQPESREQLLFLCKGVLEAMILSLGGRLDVVESKHPLLHPGCQAALKVGRSLCGHFGLMHPLLTDALDVKNDLIYAEFDVPALLALHHSEGSVRSFDFPAVRRDITLKVGMKEMAGRVARLIQKIEEPAILKENLREVTIVDQFKKAEEEFRRVTYRLTFQNEGRTLEGSEVDAAMNGVLQTLRSEHQLELA